MSEPYVDTKVRCQNPECSATFNMRLEQDTPFACEVCGGWQQAEFPCPLCQGATQHSLRVGNAWVALEPKHDHSNDPVPEPEPEPTQATEPAPEPQPDKEH